MEDYFKYVVSWYLFRDFIALCFYFIITSYLASVIYQIDIGIGIIRQIVLCYSLLTFFAIKGAMIELIRFIRTIGIFFICIGATIFSIFFLSLINDLIAWRKIFTTLIVIINKESLYNIWENRFLCILNQNYNLDISLYVILWIAIIIPIIGIIIKRIKNEGNIW